MFKTMIDGSIAYGNNEILDLFDNVIKNQISLDKQSKFHPNDKVEIIASIVDIPTGKPVGILFMQDLLLMLTMVCQVTTTLLNLLKFFKLL